MIRPKIWMLLWTQTWVFGDTKTITKMAFYHPTNVSRIKRLMVPPNLEKLIWSHSHPDLTTITFLFHKVYCDACPSSAAIKQKRWRRMLMSNFEISMLNNSTRHNTLRAVSFSWWLPNPDSSIALSERDTILQLHRTCFSCFRPVVAWFPLVNLKLCTSLGDVRLISNC